MRSAVASDPPVLNAADHQFFEDNGYVVVPNAVPQDHLDAVIDAIWWFMGADRNDRSAWYRPPYVGAATLEMHHHPAMWNTRQYPRVHRIFSELWQTEELWVSMDRIGFKPPSNDLHAHPGFLHVDADPSKEIPFGLQGVLYLTDTDETMGGFHCLPGWHKRTAEWRRYEPARSGGLKNTEWQQLPVQPIPGKAGDLLIWQSALPHGSGLNHSDRLRLAQYITMRRVPADAAARQREATERVRLWRERLPPRGFPGQPDGREVCEGELAELNPLGERLLGLRDW